MVIDMTQMLFGVRSAKLPVTTGLNGALSNSKFFYNTVALRQHRIECPTGLTIFEKYVCMCISYVLNMF